ncbi:3040_t:CDS:2 [Ambispora leptoticha]|uniref:Ubiquinone biosynthesis monooxygenase COQ6, mitochondrial n=1 Tax=Ambispora leptoticha TaxID=144679 RepID=A0A9N8WHI6_9GLOM|nr:3040_t:CDS:2 [Ambispora leptoticha]
MSSLALTLKKHVALRTNFRYSRKLSKTLATLSSNTEIFSAQKQPKQQQEKLSPFLNIKEALENVYDVIIVGGGITGLALANALATCHKTKLQKIALIESSNFSHIRGWKNDHDNANERYSNRVSSITPGSVRFLKEIGVWQKLDHTRVKPYQYMVVWDGVSDAQIFFDSEIISRSLSSLPFFLRQLDKKKDADDSDSIAWIIENSNIQHGLLSNLDHLQNKNHGKISIFDNKKVERIVSENNNDTRAHEFFDLSEWPIVELDDGQKLRARLLIGADGINSPVRSFANIETLGWDYNSHAVVATLNIDSTTHDNVNNTAWQRFLPTGPIAMLPLHSRVSSMVWSTTPQLAVKIRQMPPDQFVELVNGAFRLGIADLNYLYKIIENSSGTSDYDIGDEMRWRESVNTNKASSPVPPRVVGVQEKSRASFPLRMRNAECYVKNRVVLIGDAAHVIHPLAGQGLNQGIADVECLARVIERGVINGQDIGDVNSIQEYASKRYIKNLMMIGAVDKLHKLFSTDLTPIVWMRSLGLRMVNGLEPVKAEIMKFAMGMEHQSTD